MKREMEETDIVMSDLQIAPCVHEMSSEQQLRTLWALEGEIARLEIKTKGREMITIIV